MVSSFIMWQGLLLFGEFNHSLTLIKKSAIFEVLFSFQINNIFLHIRYMQKLIKCLHLFFFIYSIGLCTWETILPSKPKIGAAIMKRIHLYKKVFNLKNYLTYNSYQEHFFGTEKFYGFAIVNTDTLMFDADNFIFTNNITCYKNFALLPGVLMKVIFFKIMYCIKHICIYTFYRLQV